MSGARHGEGSVTNALASGGALFEPARDERAGLADVLAHEPARLDRVAAFDRLEDRAVLGHVALEQVRALAEHDPRQVAWEALVQVGERRAQAIVPGRVED